MDAGSPSDHYWRRTVSDQTPVTAWARDSLGMLRPGPARPHQASPRPGLGLRLTSRLARPGPRLGGRAVSSEAVASELREAGAERPMV